MSDILYKRILLKISGESLAAKDSALDVDTIHKIAEDVAAIYAMNVKICMVVGGGNIVRGATLAKCGIERATADYMGMMATAINAMALQESIEKRNIACRVLSAIPMTTICEPYIRRRAMRHLSKERIVIFATGTGNPFFSTDTAAVLRAVEMDCDVIVKATKVDGVYSEDPNKYENTQRYSHITYNDVISKNLNVMDTAAVALAKDNALPIIVCSLYEKNGIMQILKGEGLYTMISNA